MAATTNKNASAAKTATAKKPTLQSEQFVYTHCSPNESCNGEAGYQMRLRTCGNQQMQDFTERLSYEPPDTLIQRPESAPHRLAWLRCPVNDSETYHVLAHSRYLGRDTVGRWGNYYTRTIFYSPRIPLKRILQCWGSPLWDDTDFGDNGIEFSAKFAGLPDEGDFINDNQLERFLSDKGFPDRIGSISPDDRCRLLAWTTTACLKALDPSSSRHVYLHAEPWFVALLLYGVATILPERFLRRLTFSTFEKPGQRLRSFQFATVIGTITDAPNDGLRDEFLERQGLVLDTFTQTCSPEVEKPLFDGLDNYVFLAANGEWDKLKELHSLFSLDETTTTKTLGEAWQVHRERDLLLTHTETLSDTDVVAAIQRLRKLELGEKLLEEEAADEKGPSPDQERRQDWREELWAMIRAQCVRQPQLRQEFADILRQQLALQRHFQMIEDLLRKKDSAWYDNWRLFRALREESSKEGRRTAAADFKTLLTRVEPRSLELSTRLKLLREYQELSGSKGPLDSQLTGLLVLSDADNVWDLTTADPPFPVTWTGQALAASVCEETAKEIVQFLLGANEEDKTYGDLWMGFKNAYDMESRAENRRQKLELMFAAHPAEVLNLFFLLKSRLKFSDNDLSPPFFKSLLEDYWKQLESSPKKQYGWMHHLCDITKLEMLRPYLREDPISARIWFTALEAMGLGLLLEWTPQETNFETINSWASKASSRFPDEIEKRLEDIDENRKKISARGKGRRFLMVAMSVLVGFALGWGASEWGPSVWKLLPGHSEKNSQEKKADGQTKK